MGDELQHLQRYFLGEDLAVYDVYLDGRRLPHEHVLRAEVGERGWVKKMTGEVVRGRVECVHKREGTVIR